MGLRTGSERGQNGVRVGGVAILIRQFHWSPPAAETAGRERSPDIALKEKKCRSGQLGGKLTYIKRRVGTYSPGAINPTRTPDRGSRSLPDCPGCRLLPAAAP